MSKVTEWYPASVKPVWPGLYESRLGPQMEDHIEKRKFDGRVWWIEEVPGVWLLSGFVAFPYAQWRGLAEKPA